MPISTDVAIIGAGPYGLSLAAHLAARGVDHVVIGDPMAGWTTGMPKGMLLKSEGFASNLFDPEARTTLKQFCADRAITYADIDVPVSLENFTNYGRHFQRRHAPGMEDDLVVSVTRAASGYSLRLLTGRTIRARRVVVAVGVSPFRHIPKALRGLPSTLVTHAAEHHDLEKFRGEDVTVIGAGSSAIDMAALLHEAGAKVQLIARRDQLYVHTRSHWPRPIMERLRNPMSGIGPSWRSLFYTELPGVFYHFSQERRRRTVRRHLGPAAGWFMADRIAPVPTILGHVVQGAAVSGDRIRLDLTATDGKTQSLLTSHVIAATGYRTDMRRLPFLGDDLLGHLSMSDYAPALSPRFETSVPGLFVIGPATSYSFGPVMRFVVGAGFTARRLARHLAASRVTDPDSQTAEMVPSAAELAAE
ncbi:MAG TPA: FAD-dependent oxidoreductase [Magnetospirillaceae bacterium]|jgi:cation diffusion facilitator CzcD-associated flavoprotein CzcO